MKLIDKDALVAEIESYKSAAEWMLKGKTDLEHWRSQKGTCEKLLSFINTLEVKEVDLEKELQELNKEIIDDNGFFDPLDIAKHFFELGMLSTITEEDCKLIWNIGDDLPYMPEEDFFKELLRRYKAQKGE